MNRNFVSFIFKLLVNILILSLGIICIVEANVAIPFLRYIFIAITSIMTLINLFNAINDKNKRKELSFMAMIFLIITLFLIYFEKTYIRFIGLVVGLYILINSFIAYIEFKVRKNNHLNGTLGRIFVAILYLVFGLSLIFIPLTSTNLIFLVAGIYLVVFACINILENIYELLKTKKNISFTLPVLLSAFLPVSVFGRIKKDPNYEYLIDQDPYDDKDIAPLEVNIYVQSKGFESFGHVDICLDGTIYSYGLHDPKKRRLMGSLGDGVLVKVERNAFLKNCLKTKKTMILNFKLHPSDEDMKIIRKRVKELMIDTYAFDCDAKIQEKQGELVNADDYISDVYKDTKCELYKFNKGKFKTYFVFTTNCVLLSDTLIRNKELNLLGMNGVITPGTYMTFLYSLYLKPDSIVKGFKVYKKEK